MRVRHSLQYHSIRVFFISLHDPEEVRSVLDEKTRCDPNLGRCSERCYHSIRLPLLSAKRKCKQCSPGSSQAWKCTPPRYSLLASHRPEVDSSCPSRVTHTPFVSLPPCPPIHRRPNACRPWLCAHESCLGVTADCVWITFRALISSNAHGIDLNSPPPRNCR